MSWPEIDLNDPELDLQGETGALLTLNLAYEHLRILNFSHDAACKRLQLYLDEYFAEDRMPTLTELSP